MQHSHTMHTYLPTYLLNLHTTLLTDYGDAYSTGMVDKKNGWEEGRKEGCAHSLIATS